MNPILGISATETNYSGPGILKQEELKPQTIGVGDPGYSGPPGAEDQTRLQYKRLKEITDTMENPEAEMENILTADYIAQKLQKPTAHVYRNLDAYYQTYFQTSDIPKTTWKAVTDEFTRSYLSIQTSKLGLQMLADPYNEDLYEEYGNILAQMPEADGKDRNIFEKLLKSSASIMPSMGYVLANGLTTGAVGAGLAGLAGYALSGPAGAAVAAQQGYKWGSRVGSAKESFSLSAGGIFSEVMMIDVPDTGKKLYQIMMESEGEDREKIVNIARVPALAGGALSAAVESLGDTYSRITGTTGSFTDDVADKVIRQILKEGYATKAVSRALLKYGLNAGTEAAQEMAQEVIEKGSEEIAKFYINRAQELGIPYAELSEWGNQVKEVGMQTFLGMLGIGLPGAAVSTFRDSAEAITEKKSMTPQGYRKTEGSTAVPVSNIIPGDFSTEEYDQATATYEETAGQKTKAPIKVYKDKDGDMIAADAAAFQVALENGERAVEVEVVEGPISAVQAAAKAKPDWAMRSDEWFQRQAFNVNSLRTARDLNTLEDFKYNVKTYFPNTTAEEQEGMSWLVELGAAATGQSVDDYIRNTFSEQGFSRGILKTNKAGVDFINGGKAMIHLTNASDFSSFVHEFGHIVRRQLPKADQELLLKHYGNEDWKIKQGDDRWTSAEERFARAFETYFHTGQAPNTELKNIFQRIMDGLRKIYGAIMRAGYELEAPVKAVLDKFFSGESAAANPSQNESVFVAQGDRLFQEAPPVESDAFDEWFGFSKVVNEDGSPKVVYHGSTVQIDQFELQEASNGRMWGDGFYFTENRKDALAWANRAGGGELHEVYLSLQNPLEFTKNANEDLITISLPEDFREWILEKYDDEVLRKDNPTAYELNDFRSRLTDYAKEFGYDGIMGDFGENTHYVAFESNQVKSINNTGSWSNDDPRILYQPDEKEEIRNYLDGNAIAETTGRNVPSFEKKRELSEWADNWFKEAGKETLHRDDIGDIVLGKQGVKKSISHGLTIPKAQGIILLPDVIEKGKLIYSGEDKGRNGHVVAAPVKIGDQEYIELALLKETSQNDHRLYVHEVVLKEKAQDASIPADSFERSHGQPGLIRSIIRDLYSVNDDIQYQPLTEHEEIIRKAVEEFKPVPQDVLEEYSDRSWAQHEMKRREILKDYSWLEDWADTETWEEFRDNLLEAHEFMFSDEEKEAMSALGGAEDRFFKEIWSRANLATRDEKNEQFIKQYGNREGVLALARDVAPNLKTWGGSGMPPAIFQLATNMIHNHPHTDKQINAAIASIENNPVRVRESLASVNGDELEMMQLQYEEEIEEATPYQVKVKRMSQDERLNLYAKTEDPEIRKMLLSGIGTDQETLEKMDAAINKRMATLKMMQTKEENELKAKLAEEERKVDSLRSTLRRKEKEYQEATAEAKVEREAELAALREELNEKRKASEKKIREKRDEKIKQIKEEIRANQTKRKELLKVKALSRKYAKNIMKAPAQTCHVEYKKKILEFQEQLNMDPNYRRKSTLEEFASVRDRLLQDPEAEKYYSQSFLKTAFAKSLNDWNLQELELINARMNDLRKRGRLAFIDELENRRRARDADINQILLEVLDHEPVGSLYAEGTKERDKEKRTSLKHKIDIATLTPGRIFRDLAGEESRLAELFDDMINYATDQELDSVKNRQKKMADLRKELGIKDADLIKEITGPYGTFTVDQVIHMWTVRDNIDNMKAIIHGNKVTNPREYTGQLTKEQKAYGDALRSDFEEHREEYAKAIGKYTHGIMGIVDKGYFPMYRRGKVGETHESELLKEVTAAAGVAKAYAKKDRSKSRVKIRDEHQAPIELGASIVWQKGMVENEHFIAFAEKIRYLQSIVDNAHFQKGMTEAWGTEITKWFKKYVNDVAEPTLFKTYDGLSQVSKQLRQNRAMAYLAGNALTVLKQFGSFSTFFRDVPVHYMMASAAEFSVNHVKIEKFVWDRDPQIAERVMNREMEELKYAKTNDVVKVVQKATGGIMKAITWMDKNTVMIGWKAAYDYQIKKGASEQEAIRYAQRAVLETQPSARAKDLAQIYRSGEGYNWFLMFTNQLNKNWNILWSDIPRAVRNLQMGKAVASFTGLLVSIYAISLVSGWRPWEEDDPEELMKSILFQTMKGFLGFVPFIGSAASSAFEGWSSGGVDPFPFAAPAGNMARKIMEGDWEGAGDVLPALAEGVGTIVGLPVVLAKRAANAAGEISNEEYLKAIAEFVGYHYDD